ncbi:MAG: hypothetical protein U9R15_13055 [Chloroflexota bacterium]|nr:hypothetical protein [Chloroflexota bacterium]
MIGSIAREYLEVIDHIRYGQFANTHELRYLEGQRALLHQQMIELLGYEPTMAQVRAIALQAQAEGDYDG